MDKETIVQLLSDGVISNEAAARYFPELEEIEDEKVKEELINTINLAYDCGIAITKEYRDKYLAWIEKLGDVIPYVEKLEKQDEPTEINSEFDSQLNRLLKQFESLPKEELASSLSFYLNVVQNDGTYKIEDEPNVCEGCNNVKGCLACVDGSEWAHIEEAKSFWSEKDENRFRNLIYLVEHSNEGRGTKEGLVKFIYRLKSLKSQNTWKPSDKQMELLKEACDQHWEPDGLDPLYTLYQDLKKLREDL